jgi:chromosome segregation ATPase
MSEDRTFTESEHFALLTAAVTQETETLQSALAASSEEITTLKNTVDVLQAKVSESDEAKEQIASEFAEFKADLERKAELEKFSAERSAQIREAHPHLTDDYFTSDRVERWAAMSAESFASLVEDLAAATASKTDDADDDTTPRATAAFGGTVASGSTKGPSLGGYLATVLTVGKE